MAGRKRLPAKFHIVKGTDRPCRTNSREPKAPPEPPRAPEWLSRRVSEIFGVLTGRLQAMGLASSGDTEMLALLASRLEEWEARDAEVRANGAVYAKVELIEVPGEPGQPSSVRAQKVWKANPAVAQRSEAMRHAQSLLAEFGLSPASRGKVSAAQGTDSGSDNPWESLVNG